MSTRNVSIHWRTRVINVKKTNLTSQSDQNDDQVERLRQALLKLTQLEAVQGKIDHLHETMFDPKAVAERVDPILVSVLKKGVGEDPDGYADAIAPVISSAIRIQTRENEPEVVSALYPVIGQTIGKAIGEAFRDLRRSIDARLQQNFNFRTRFRRFFLRLRGISESELLLREALPYKVKHVFLIHRKTGLLLQHLSDTGDSANMDIISAMLTAIQDFARDAFGGRDATDERLEEIQYGDSRILLDAGTYVYLAVVVKGFEPVGYNTLLNRIVNAINLEYANILTRFDGDMTDVPDFEPVFEMLLNPPVSDIEGETQQSELSRGQKIFFSIGFLVVILMLLLSIFYCVFTIRLLPIAFAPLVTPTSTFTTTMTNSPTPLPTDTPYPTFTNQPTSTPAPTATQTPLPVMVNAIMTGNVWVRLAPDVAAEHYDMVIQRNTTVNVVASFGKWVKITWVSQYGAQQGWVPVQWVGLLGALPDSIVTPIQNP